MNIYLSPSPQEHNIGAGNYGTEEQRMNQLVDVLSPMLIKYKHVIYRNNPTMSLAQIVADSNSKNVDLHLALHTNASNGTARGCVVFCYKLGFSGEKYAKVIYKHLEALTPTPDRGVKANPNLYELSLTKAPAVLVEIDFHDNADSAQWLVNNMVAIARAITNAINEVAGIKTIEEPDYKQKYFDLLNAVKDLLNKYQKEV